MAETFLQNSDSVRYVLQSEVSDTLTLSQEPDGWLNDELEIDRDKKWHGVFNKVTNDLSFYGEAKDYINLTFEILGHNANLYLIKYKLEKDVVGNTATNENAMKWNVDYIGIADWDTKTEKDYSLKIKFHSNPLKKLLESHESDEFEIERDDDIDGNTIVPQRKNLCSLQGRRLNTRGEAIMIKDNGEQAFIFNTQLAQGFASVRTETVVDGAERFSSIDSIQFSNNNGQEPSASNMFYVKVEDSNSPDVLLWLEMDLRARNTENGSGAYSNVDVDLVHYRWDGANYNVENSIQLMRLNEDFTYKDVFTNVSIGIEGDLPWDIQYTDGLAIRVGRNDGANEFTTRWDRHTITLQEESYVEPSIDLSFLFVNSVLERLMYIITGKTKKFYSKLFGRLITNQTYEIETQNYNYDVDGDYGKIGLISGFWLRKYNEDSEKYKPLKTSLKDILDSLKSVFNVGVSIDKNGFEERLRVEDLKYYYQNKVATKLPTQVQNEQRKVDNSLYFSGVTMGYNKGGDYENEVGLDEPNTKTEFVTPLRKTKNKYTKTSKIRSDDYGAEIQRRKPQEVYPEEDLNGDEDNWFLDLKLDDNGGNTYIQTEWADRLDEVPTGVLSPETYRSFLFTPIRMLLRHGWMLRAGMEQKVHLSDGAAKFVSKIKYISSKANSTLGLNFTLPAAEPLRKENEDVKVGDLDRARFLPEIITFEHAVDDDLMAQIQGTTRVEYPEDSGFYEEVPNVYFKFEWINQKGEAERGYLLNLKPNKSGTFTMQKANENIY